jgi:UPF0176 protein
MTIVHSAFYRFVRLADPSGVCAYVREAASELTGSIIVAAEGINGTVAGAPVEVTAFEGRLTDHVAFSGMSFKHSACNTPPFGRLKVHLKDRIVAFGEPDDAVFAERTTAVAPQAWRELIARDNVIVIDNRNSFEHRLGCFENAVDPGVSHFSDFQSYVETHAPAWRRDGKSIAMYCTGGIRCERVAPWMQRLGLDVFELDGGILNYFQQMPDAERDWQGECFVFDNRVAIDTRLRPCTRPSLMARGASLGRSDCVMRSMTIARAVD